MHAAASAYLRACTVGRRFQFALGPEGLALTDIAEPAAAVRDAHAGVVDQLGVGWVSPAGPLVFAGPRLSRDTLVTLADLAREHGGRHPGLRALVGSRLLRMERDGTVVERIADADAWGDLHPGPVAGTLLATAKTVTSMRVGKPYVFWMADRTAGGGAHVIVHPQRGDADATVAGWAASLRVAGAREAFGVARITDRRALLLLTEQSIDGATAVLDAVAALVDDHPALRPLASARVVRLSAGAASGYARHDGPVQPDVDLERATEHLRHVRGGGRCLIWFNASGPDGWPVLVLGSDSDVFEAAVSSTLAATAVPGAQVMGRLGLVERRPLLKASRASPDIVYDLAGFVRAHRERWPALKLLRGLRIAVKASDGSISSQTAAGLWE